MKRRRTKITYSDPLDPKVKRLLTSSLEYLTGRARLEKRYQRVLDQRLPPSELWSEIANQLGIQANIEGFRIPKDQFKKPTIVIANHPYGVVDGILLGEWVSQYCQQFKFLVNEALCKNESLNQFFLPVDFRPNKAAALTNIQTKQRAKEALLKGEPIVIFPSGGVATSPKFWKPAEDLEWKRFVVRLIHSAKADVIPIYFEGQNSRVFQIASSVHVSLRMALLLREVTNKLNKSFDMKIGQAISAEKLKTIGDIDQQLAFLRSAVLEMSVEEI
ncbi:MAG: lysophospholipid acyltransferase family protein [Flavobacteriales bacterium]|nr:lysophospholipid acyltransferase family protein [Flavobacteriales bacterium]